MPDRFRRELDQFAEPAKPLPIVDVPDPESHGWLRRPEFDQDGVAAWEQPDGTLVGMPSGRLARRPLG